MKIKEIHDLMNELDKQINDDVERRYELEINPISKTVKYMEFDKKGNLIFMSGSCKARDFHTR